jgi:phospholipid/cholesterol/gamma-HCH transport system substrate-binding protein
MNEFRKNVVVGAVVLTALIALGTMIILFGEAPQALTSVYRVSMYFPTAGTIQNADPVYVNGVQVGQVEYTAAMSDIRKGVQIVTAIQTRYRIPIDAVPFIKEQGVGFGKSSIRIDVDERNSSTMLPTDGSASLQGQVGGGAAEFIPKQTLKAIEDAGAALADLAKGLRPVADDLHALLKPTTTQEADSTTQPDRPLANLSTAVQRLDQTLKGLNQIVADPNNQKNIRVTLENFRTVSKDTAALAKELREVTNKTDQRLERVSRGLIENTDKLSHLLDSLKQASDKLSTSEGSAGRFLTDPELYDALTFSAKRLGLAINDLHELLQQWREKGLKVQGGLLGR